ncbi:hypothetical protein [Pseudomonas sp. fls2-241-TYG-175]|uniref:hypothetical protein n=1 Tax=Pseudomonas sp. fls2-241-TYG-175 TaxID=3040312 RepID=UPI002552D9AF|nr:hypothetical protein [Pseudomonas sp. fls2-241-TYG-175]
METDSQVKKVLANPIFIISDDAALKIKTQLMVISFIALFLTLGGVHVDQGSIFFGLRFTGLTEQVVRLGLFIIIAYMAVHFIWISYDALQEWEIRTTGTKKSFAPVVKNDLEENFRPSLPSDPRQSTLYFWWTTQAGRIGDLSSMMQKCSEEISHLPQEILEVLRERHDRKLDQVRVRLDGIDTQLTSLERSVKSALGTYESSQINDSLKVFDRRFHMFLASQNLRWLVFDFLVPVLLAGFALFHLVESEEILKIIF